MCEERDRGQTEDIRESLWIVSLRGIPPMSAAWGVSEGEEGTQHRVCCLCQAPLPVPVTAVAVQRGQRIPGSSALQQGSLAKQRDFGLMQGLFEFWQFSFCDLKSVFSGFLSCFVHAASSVQAFCLNQAHAGRMTGSSQFDSWPGTPQKSTFLLP